MTVQDTENDGPTGGKKGTIQRMDHSELIEDMKRTSKLTIEQRIELAKQRREQQLLQYYASVDGGSQSKGSRSRLTFTEDVQIMDATSKGSFTDLEEMLNIRGLDPNSCNSEGMTALHQSCIDGREDLVKLLLEHGASVNVMDKDGWSPLHAAATCGQKDIAKLLIEKGADLLAVNTDGDMPFDITEDDATQQLIESEMVKHGITPETVEQKRQQLHRTLLQDIETLLNEGHGLNVPVNPEQARLLHIAIVHQLNDIVITLLERNDVHHDEVDTDGWQPVHAAAYWGNTDALKMLVEKRNADLTAKTGRGQTPLDLADDHLTKLLIQQLMLERHLSISSSSSNEESVEEDDLTSKANNELQEIKESYDDKVDQQNVIDPPLLRRVESVSTGRNSMREAKKHAPVIRYSQVNRTDAPELYDDSYDRLLLKSKGKGNETVVKVDSNDNINEKVYAPPKIIVDDKNTVTKVSEKIVIHRKRRSSSCSNSSSTDSDESHRGEYIVNPEADTVTEITIQTSANKQLMDREQETSEELPSITYKSETHLPSEPPPIVAMHDKELSPRNPIPSPRTVFVETNQESNKSLNVSVTQAQSNSVDSNLYSNDKSQEHRDNINSKSFASDGAQKQTDTDYENYDSNCSSELNNAEKIAVKNLEIPTNRDYENDERASVSSSSSSYSGSSKEENVTSKHDKPDTNKTEKKQERELIHFNSESVNEYEERSEQNSNQSYSNIYENESPQTQHKITTRQRMFILPPLSESEIPKEGTLRHLKLMRQKSLYEMLQKKAESIPASNYEDEATDQQSTGPSKERNKYSSGKSAFQPPDSPTVNRRIYKQLLEEPEKHPSKPFIIKKKSCIIM